MHSEPHQDDWLGDLDCRMTSNERFQLSMANQVYKFDEREKIKYW